MRRVSIFGVFIALVGLLLSSTVTVAHPEQPEHVIIVTIDGARPDKLAEADTPNIDDVAASGAVALTCTSVFPAKTPSAHASLFTGARPELHGFYAPGDELRAETIFQVFEEAGYKTALIDGKGGRIAGLEGNVTHVKMDVDYRWLPGENEWEEGSVSSEPSSHSFSPGSQR
jgi:arylsulfatase A-like enzyme